MRASVLLCLLSLLVCGCTPPAGRPAAPSGPAPSATSGTMSTAPTRTTDEVTVSGELIYRERMALPGECDVWVQLIEVDALGRTLNVLGESLETATKPGIPLPYSVSYVPALISPDSHAALQARILYQGETLFATPAPLPIQLPAPASVSILTKRFFSDASKDDTSTDPDPASLTGRRWQLRTLYSADAEVFDNQPAPHIVFHPDARDASFGRLSGSDGCNLITATYELTEDGLDIRENALTMRMCPMGMEQARALAVALEETDNWRLKGKKLEARQNDRILAVFEAIAL